MAALAPGSREEPPGRRAGKFPPILMQLIMVKSSLMKNMLAFHIQLIIYRLSFQKRKV